MSQPSLFDAPPRQRHSATSCAAAEAITPHLSRLQQRVLEFIRERGPLTDNEGIAWSGIGASTYRPRRIELVRKGLVVACGERDGSQTWRVK